MGFQQRPEMLPQALCCPEHRVELRQSWPRRWLTLVHRPCDLVEIPAEGGELLDGLLEERVLRIWERRCAPKMRSGEVGQISR